MAWVARPREEARSSAGWATAIASAPTTGRTATGVSETVDGPLTGNDSVEDLHALLAAADVPEPSVLSASFEA
jgi:uncharacterized protein with LGFP repeats